MSDPMVNAEIEDVLSSIRRLVSAEERADRAGHGRAEPDSGMQPETSLREPRGGARLVLTPAQRIDDTSEPSQPDGIDIEPAWADDAASDTWDGIEDAEIVEAEAEAGAEAEAHEDAVPDASGLTPEAGSRDAPADEGEEVDIGVLEARIASFESAVARQQGDWEPDDGLTAENAAAPGAPLPWQDMDGADASAQAGQTAADAPEDGLAPDADALGPPEAGDTPAQVPHAERPATADAIGAGSEGGLWRDEDTVLDEDALRDLVSEIVRQELQGALGERITRNVRKLVRREIHRALTAQELED